MKKIFSTVAMAVVALTAVVSMSSCSNDDSSSFNAAPTVTPATQPTTVNNAPSTLNYEYKADVSNDVFELYNVTLTRTIGSESKDYTFTNAKDMKNVMTTGLDQFSAGNATSVKIEAKVTLKDNYQEVIDKMIKTVGEDEDGEVIAHLVAKPVFKFTATNGGMLNNDREGFDFSTDVKVADKAQLEKIATYIGKALSVHNN